MQQKAEPNREHAQECFSNAEECTDPAAVPTAAWCTADALFRAAAAAPAHPPAAGQQLGRQPERPGRAAQNVSPELPFGTPGGSGTRNNGHSPL